MSEQTPPDESKAAVGQSALNVELGDLLPCPFCGGKPKKQETDDGGKYICCDYCNASTALHYDRAANLIDAWNVRVAPN